MKEIKKYTVETSTGFWQCFTTDQYLAVYSFHNNQEVEYDGQEIKEEPFVTGKAVKVDVLSSQSLYFIDNIRKELTYLDKSVFGLMGLDKVIQSLDWVIDDFEDSEGMTIFYFFSRDEDRGENKRLQELIKYIGSTDNP